MRKKKFKSAIDLISYDEFVQIFYDFQNFRNNAKNENKKMEN